jgi:serine/threonine protein kinase
MSRSGPPPLAAGAEVAPGYTVIEHLSRGRALDVYDAWSSTRGTRCIVKVLRPDREDDRPATRRLLAEGRLIRRLCHPHIVRGYEVLTEPRTAVVMETLTGQTVAHLIEESDPRLPVRDIAHLGLHVGSAIRYLHAAGWLHLDLKPSNIVAEAGRAVLIDMSVARRPGRAGGGVGTWCYMAPEQVRGGGLGPAADVWGLGVVLYEALTGQAAFDPDPDPREDADTSSSSASSSSGESSASWETSSLDTAARDARPRRQIDGPPAPIRRLRRRVPGELIALIDACLAPEAADRPGVEAVMAALEPLAGLPPSERRWTQATKR